MKPITAFTILKMVFAGQLLLTMHLYAQDWPMVDACKERTSWAELETQLGPPLKKTVVFSLDGTASGLSCCGDTLFVSVEHDPNMVVAFNARNGSELWHFEIPGTLGSVNVSPAVNDSIVLCGGQHGLGLYALDRYSGLEKWFKGIGTLYSKNPIIDNNRVYIVGDSLYCLNISDGSTIWAFSFSATVTPVVDSERVYVCGDRRLMALNKLNGEIVWQSDNSQKYYSSLTVDESFLYSCNNDSIIALDKVTGSLHWAYGIPGGKLPDFSTNAMAITDSFLCFSVWEDAHGKGEIHTLDIRNGHYRWHYTFDTTGAYSPVIANGMVYLISGRSYDLWGFDLNTGLDVFFDDSERFLKQPIVADGKLFVGAFGKVVAFENYAIGTDKMAAGLQRPPELLQNSPNPFRQSTSIRFHLLQPGHLDISVFDLTGRRVRTISATRYEAGTHTMTWDGTDDSHQRVPSGTYILRLTSNVIVRSHRMLLLE